MPSAREKVRTRLVSTDLERWNHKWRAILSMPLCWPVGSAIGFFGGVHLLPSSVPDGVTVLLFGVAAMILGGIVLAAID